MTEKNTIPHADIGANLESLLAAVKSELDPVLLTQYRKEFRKHVPFHLRSYVAAAMLYKSMNGDQRYNRRPRPERAPVTRERFERPPREDRPQGPRDEVRFQGEGASIFIAAGKRQKFFPRILLAILADVAKIGPEDVGMIRPFDNYTFADINPERVDAAIDALNGYNFRGRGLVVNKARKKDELAAENSEQPNVSEPEAPPAAN